jgi:lipopolysaccharide/colanic/teichoic acid biosynthesis glycosyltransferase
MLLITPPSSGPKAFPLAPPNRSTPSVLSISEFETMFERERCLADRGTRLFCLMMLRQVHGDSLQLVRLSRHLVARLRSTDLVAQLDRDHLAVLLADTGPTEARFVAAWIDREVVALGIRIESTIYVYPEASDASVRRNGHGDADGDLNEPSIGRGRSEVTLPEGHGGNGQTNGNGSGGSNGHNGAHAEGASKTNGHDPRILVSPESEPANSQSGWRVEDLWTCLSVPTPPWKRALDIVVSAIGLMVLFPFFVLVAIAIKLDSPGPVIFEQKRAGRGGRPFVFYKFRSMFVDAESRRAELEAKNEQKGPVFKIRNDPRLTRVGRLLRRWSVDEMPQLWNVLKGDFSLVGPRPPTLNEVPGYARWQRRRLSVSGGLTCIWQVSGRNNIGFEEWMRMDMQYIRRRGFWTDAGLVARTVSAVISGRGAY